MDSLVANYASSDEEEDDQTKSICHASFPSLPNSKFSSTASYPLLPIQSHLHHQASHRNSNTEAGDVATTPSSFSSCSSLFSSIPPPKSYLRHEYVPDFSSPDSIPKKVVQFRPPINPPAVNPDDLDEEDACNEQKNGNKNKDESHQLHLQSTSGKSFLSSMPAPKNSSTLGLLPPAAGSGRKSIVESEPPASMSADSTPEIEPDAGKTIDNFENSLTNRVVRAAYSNRSCGGSDLVLGDDGYGQCGNKMNDGSASMASSEAPLIVENIAKVPRKRGRNESPFQVIEVKQDELMKNRPREDQLKLTGIAFGPAYQGVSTKGKPSKLHKRKHQIGSLYYDMKQKEMELAEQRARGMRTKAETQGKYGW